MSYENWQSDADFLFCSLPQESPSRARIDYLLTLVAPRGVEVDPTIFDKPDTTGREHLTAKNSFFVTDKVGLQKSSSTLGSWARKPSLAFVGHDSTLRSPSVLALPPHKTDNRLGNASVLLHELEHMTEPENDLLNRSSGLRERRAYQLGSSTMHDIDGSDFIGYIDRWPTTFTASQDNGSISISFHDVECPKPPSETFMHDMWIEGGDSKRLLQSVGRMASLETVTTSLSQHLIDQLAESLVL